MTFLNQKGHSVQRTIDTSKQPPNHKHQTDLRAGFYLVGKIPPGILSYRHTFRPEGGKIVIFSTKHLLGKTILGVATIITNVGLTILDHCDIFFERCYYNDNEGESEAF